MHGCTVVFNINYVVCWHTAIIPHLKFAVHRCTAINVMKFHGALVHYELKTFFYQIKVMVLAEGGVDK